MKKSKSGIIKKKDSYLKYIKYYDLQYVDEEFYDNIVGLIESVRDNELSADKENYRKVVSEVFRQYMYLVENTVKNGDAIKRAYDNCEYVKRILKSIHEGLHSRAFRQLHNLLGTLKKLLFVEISKEQVFYRMRISDKRKSLTRGDIFHIPLQQTRKITTQRYSAPGYPCLYLANSLYACWEEMGRPDTNKVLVSAFKNNDSFKLVDLRVPNLQTFFEQTEKYIVLFPLILACSVPVINTKDIYKPEYSFPQLVLEWVISNRRDTKAIGVYFTSAFKNNDFFSGLESKWDNMAIPVQNPLSHKMFCPQLSSLFKLTKPTCYEYEKICGNIDDGPVWMDLGDDNKEYDFSQFGKMETLVKKKTFDVVYTKEQD